MKKTVAAGATVAAAGTLGAMAPGAATAAAVPVKWDKVTDVVVVGTGFAGLSAAITAKEAGAKVIVLEKAKQAHEGGNSKVSGNMWWTPTNEKDGLAYLKALAMGTTEDECFEEFIQYHVKLNDWLSGKFGIKPAYIGGLFQPEHPELPGHEGVRTWGHEGKWGNGEIYGPIRAYAENLKIEFLYETPAKELIQLPKGEVLGVKAEKNGKAFFIKAQKGVFLGSGGFEFDFDMAKQFLPGWPVYGRGTPYNTGDGIKMCQRIGAQLWHMNNTLGGFGCLMVPEWQPILLNLAMKANGYVFLDKFGQRFMNEKRDNRHGFGHKEYQLFFDGIIGDFTRIPWWTVFDDATAKKGPVSFTRGKTFTWFNAHSGYRWSEDNSAEVAKGWILKADDWAGLAGKMQISAEALIKSVNKYNEFCKGKADGDFNRPAATLLPLEQGPFYAMKTFPATYNTQGGPKRNGKCQILDMDNKPIPRLYSGGEMGSFYGWMYNGGGNVAECFITGQIAGKYISALKPWK